MQYLIQYKYYKNEERMFDWAWTPENTTTEVDFTSLANDFHKAFLFVLFNRTKNDTDKLELLRKLVSILEDFDRRFD